MNDTSDQRGSPDDQFINIDDCDELRHWSRLLKTDSKTLKEAVARVGNAAEKVQAYCRNARVSGAL